MVSAISLTFQHNSTQPVCEIRLWILLANLYWHLTAWIDILLQLQNVLFDNLSSISVNELKITNQSVVSCHVCAINFQQNCMNSLRDACIYHVVLVDIEYFIAFLNSISIFHTLYYKVLMPKFACCHALV